VIGRVHGPDVVNQTIKALGKTWTFDFDERFGPLWLRHDGEPRKNQVVSKAIWDAWEIWHKDYLAKKAQTEHPGASDRLAGGVS
jgi:hypothetical protein